MLKIKHKKVFLGALLSSLIFNDSAFSMQAIEERVDLGNGKGKIVSCIGHVMEINQAECINPGNKKKCTNVSVFKCPIHDERIEVAYCNINNLDKTFIKKYEALKPIELNQDKIAQELYEQGKMESFYIKNGPINTDNSNQNVLLTEMRKRIILRPKAKITGGLEYCRIPLNGPSIYAVGTCYISNCKIELINKKR